MNRVSPIRRAVRRLVNPIRRILHRHGFDSIRNHRQTGQLIKALGRCLEHDSVPLPRIIHLETRTRCHGRCAFCAASIQTDTRPDVTMSDELIGRILEDLAEWGYANRLSIYNNNEPFLDKRIYDIVARARKALPDAYLELKSNGMTLNMEKVRHVFNAGLDTLYINDYRERDLVDKGEHSQNILKIKRTVEASRRYRGHYAGRKSWSPRVVIDLRDIGEVLDNRAGTAPNGMRITKPLRRSCMRPFEMISINPNGLVALCSNDLNFDAPMGDVNRSKLREIWLSPEYDAVRRRLLAGDRSVKSTCAECDYSGHTDEILEEYGISPS